MFEPISPTSTDSSLNLQKKLQAMDNSHVALVALALRTNGFSQFR